MNPTSAVCAQADPDAFYPPKGGNTAQAIALCQTCPLVDACLEWALHHREGNHGVWGATTVRERRRIRAERGITLPTEADLTRAKVDARLAWGWTATMIADDLGMHATHINAYQRAAS